MIKVCEHVVPKKGTAEGCWRLGDAETSLPTCLTVHLGIANIFLTTRLATNEELQLTVGNYLVSKVPILYGTLPTTLPE